MAFLKTIEKTAADRYVYTRLGVLETLVSLLVSSFDFSHIRLYILHVSQSSHLCILVLCAYSFSFYSLQSPSLQRKRSPSSRFLRRIPSAPKLLASSSPHHPRTKNAFPTPPAIPHQHNFSSYHLAFPNTNTTSNTSTSTRHLHPIISTRDYSSSGRILHKHNPQHNSRHNKRRSHPPRQNNHHPHPHLLTNHSPR